MIKFMHIRPTLPWGRGDSMSMFGGVTVAFTCDEPDEQGNRLLQYTVAKCGKHQAYNRRLGRLIAGGRLECTRQSSFGKHVKMLIINVKDNPFAVLAERVKA